MRLVKVVYTIQKSMRLDHLPFVFLNYVPIFEPLIGFSCRIGNLPEFANKLFFSDWVIWKVLIIFI